MSVARLLAIALIIVCTGVAWFILGASVAVRTGETDSRLAREVERLWGGKHDQIAPQAWFERTRIVVENTAPAGPGAESGTKTPGAATSGPVTKTVVDRIAVPIVQSRIDVSLALDQRRKGLLWYDTYAVTFSGKYRLRNTDPEAQVVFAQFRFPSAEALYDALVVRLDGVDLGEVGDLSRGISVRAHLPAGGESTLEVSYRSRGLGEWTYTFAPEGIAQVRDFTMNVTTDCDGIDFPAGSIAPGSRARDGRGWRLTWNFENLVTGQRIGVDLPNRLNPGPVAARITFFAPVSLLFFVTVLVILGILGGRSLHPMHFFFLSAAFFAFHLLLAYLVDHLDINLSFAIASVTSVALVVSYLARVTGWRFALWRAGAAQAVFLVLFSYVFFFEGYVGLTVTIGSILTLFVLMQATAKVDWAKVFGAAQS
jgi:inner membrane protein CreD